LVRYDFNRFAVYLSFSRPTFITHILHNFWTSTHRGEASPLTPSGGATGSSLLSDNILIILDATEISREINGNAQSFIVVFCIQTFSTAAKLRKMQSEDVCTRRIILGFLRRHRNITAVRQTIIFRPPLMVWFVVSSSFFGGVMTFRFYGYG